MEERLASVAGTYGSLMMREGVTMEQAEEGLTPARMAWNTVGVLWSRVEHRLAEEAAHGVKPALIWR